MTATLDQELSALLNGLATTIDMQEQRVAYLIGLIQTGRADETVLKDRHETAGMLRANYDIWRRLDSLLTRETKRVVSSALAGPMDNGNG